MQLSETSHNTDESEAGEGLDASKNNEDRYYITALARGLEVLACFRSADKGLTNQQIAERCGLPKSTVTRITYTLTSASWRGR
jgi:CRP-like cAMP-binding protein